MISVGAPVEADARAALTPNRIVDAPMCVDMTALVATQARGLNDLSTHVVASVREGARDERSAKVKPGGARWMETAAVRYTVAPGDTLSGIAQTYSVSVSDIRRWNRLRGDHLRPGQELVLYVQGAAASRRRIEHAVRSGQTGLGIAIRYGVSIDELGRWNPGVDMDRLRIGQELYVFVSSGGGGSTATGGDSAPGEPRAVGAPNSGRLHNGVQLETGPGIVVRDPSEAYGMPVTVDALRYGYARVQAVFPNAPDVSVGDLSAAGGGRLSPHRSHQNGLDVDVAYYVDGAGALCALGDPGVGALDVELQWYLFRLWLEWDVLEYIFVDYAFQEVLYAQAVEEGATEDELTRWFQYPRGIGAARGIIRHTRGHRTHYHARFRVGRSMP